MSWIGIWYETMSRFGSARAELAQRVVERDGCLRGAALDLVQVAEPAHLAVEDFLRDAVEVHVLEARLRVGVARAAPCCAAGTRSMSGACLRDVSHAWFTAPGARRHLRREAARRLVVLVVVLRREMLAYAVVADLDVRVGGDQQLLRGACRRSSSSRALLTVRCGSLPIARATGRRWRRHSDH